MEVVVTVAGAQGVARGRVRMERAEAEATGQGRLERVEAATAEVVRAVATEVVATVAGA